MRKFLCLWLSLFVFCCTGALSRAQLAYIADAPAVVNPGETFLVPVVLNGTIENLNAIRVDITFDPNHFEITSNTKSTVIQLGGGFFDGGTNNISYINVPSGPSMGPVNSSGLIQLLVGRQGIGGNPNPVPVATGLAFNLQLRCKASAPLQTTSFIALSNAEAVQIVGESQQQLFLDAQGDETCIGGNCNVLQVNELCILAPSTVGAGESFTATVRIDNADRDFSSIAVQIRYNTIYLNALSVTRSDEYISDFEEVPPTINDALGIVDVLISGENSGNGPGGVLFTIVFQVNPNPTSTTVADMFIVTDGEATSGTTLDANYTDLNNTCGTTYITIDIPVTECPEGAIFATGPTTFCEGGSVILVGEIINSEGASYQWWTAGGGLTPIPGATSPTYEATASNVYVLQVIKEGCDDLITNGIEVIVNPLPEFSAFAEPSVICAGGTTTLTAVGNVDFVWTDGVEFVEGSEVDVTLEATATFTVVGTDANGCSSGATVTVTVNPNPTVTINGPTTALVGQEVEFTASGAVSYVWSTGQEGETITGMSDEPGEVTICVTGTDANGCQGTDCFTIVFVGEGTCPSLAEIAYQGESSFCNGGSVDLFAVTDDAGASFQWWVDVGNGLTTINGATGASYTATAAGVYYLQVLKDGCDAIVSSGLEVTVLPNPEISIINLTPETCLSLGVILSATGAGENGIYDWGGDIVTTEGEFIVDYPAEPGTYEYTVVGIDANGCFGLASTIVTVYPDPDVQILSSDQDNTICQGESVTLTAVGAEPGASYLWIFGEMMAEGSEITVSPNESTTYVVYGQNEIGCLDIEEVTINVAANPEIEVFSPGVVCVGDIAGVGAIGADFYLWSNGEEGDFTFFYPTETTTYSVIGYNELGCSSVVEFTIFVNPAPQIEVSASSTTVYTGQSVTLTASGGVFYEWYPDNLLVEAFGQTVNTVGLQETTTFSVYGEDANGCFGMAEITIEVIEFVPQGSICVNAPAEVEPNSEFDVQIVVTGSNVAFNAVTATLAYDNAYLEFVSATAGDFIPNATAMAMDNGSSVEVMLAATPPDASVTETGLVYTIRFRVNPNPSIATSAPFTIVNSMAIPQDFDQVMLDACPTVFTTLLPLCPQVAMISAGGPTEICEGGSVTLSAMTDLDGAVIQWWANGEPLGIFGSELVVETSGVYAVSVSYFECPILISNEIGVTVYEQPMPMITGAPEAICLANSNIQLGATIDGGMFTSEPEGAVGMDGTFIPSETGLYTITYSGVSGPCTYSTSVTIEVTADPVVTVFGLNAFYCANGARTTLSGQPAGGTFSGPGVDGDEFSPVLAGPGTHVVTYSGESNGCFYTASYEVVVGAAISVALVSAEGPTSITQNNGSISVTATGGVGGFTYTLGSESNETGVFENLYAGLYVVTATDAAGCSQSFAYNLEVVDQCPAPENVQVSNLSSNQVTLSWNPVAEGINYVVQYRLLTQANWTIITTGSNSLVLTGLQANSRYVAQVQTLCEGGTPSTFSITITFTTTSGQLVGCVNPEFWITNVTSTSAVVNWTPVSQATHYHVQYKRANVTGVWTSINVLAPATSQTISGLLPNTAYEYRVRTRCGATTLAWPASQLFVTQGGAKLADAEPAVLSVYPNPNQGEFSIRFDAENPGLASVKVLDLAGRTIFANQFAVESGLNVVPVSVSNYVRGLYIVEFRMGEMTRTVKMSLE